MSDLSVTLTPGYTFSADELVTIEKLNALSSPTIILSGSIGTLTIADGSVTTAKLATGALSNDVTGRSKMADSYLSADASGRAKMAANYISADATGRAFMQPGYFTADATGQGKFANGFLTNDSAGRTLMADAYFSADDTATTGGRAKFAANIWTIGKMAPGVSCPPHYGSFRNLYVKPGGGAGLMSVDLTTWAGGGEAILADPSGNAYRFVKPATVTIDLSVSQNLNGRDTAAAIVNPQWYYIWLITDGTNLKGVFSASADAATVETNLRASSNFNNYSAKCLVGFAYNNGAPSFTTIRIQDRQFLIPDVAIWNNQAGNAAYQTINLATLVPPIAKSVQGTAGVTSGASVGQCAIQVAGDSSGNGSQTIVVKEIGTGVNGFFASGGFTVPIVATSAQQIAARTSTVSAVYGVNISGGTW